MNISSDSEYLKNLGQLVIDQLIAYRSRSMTGADKVLELKPFHELDNKLGLDKFVQQQPISVQEFQQFLDLYLHNSMHIHHPRNIGHQLAPSRFPTVLADMIVSAMNNGSGLYEMGPSASVVERWVINWMLNKIGWSSDIGYQASGVLCSGGTMANITALSAARNLASPSTWKYGCNEQQVILTSAESHFSISRAAGILGIGCDNVITIASDDTGKLLVDDLSKAITKLQDSDKKIVAVVANACTTSSGVYDDLVAIAEVCNKNKIWMHVDGAHGASAILSEKYSHLLSGIELADSVTWDAHKMLQTTSVCAGALFKRSKNIDAAFTGSAPYLSLDEDCDYPNQMRRTIECTKPAIGLKLYLTLALLGEGEVASIIENLYQKALGFYDIINTRDEFECLCKPESNILCFRIAGKCRDEQKAIRNRLIQKDGFYITETEVNGDHYFRLTVMNEATSSSDISTLLDLIIGYGDLGGNNDLID